ncbi:MAG: hypothetical protein AMJ79_02635 [Phycisphaerae bacterium SM23_30]|nr:MAG: hypothetical protein AMJ79_02635 [Phycisphaerae bacterium SM23_30]
MKEDKNNLNKQEQRSASPGCVYLAGAGPGDPGLITLRAMQLIEEADVIVHDYLVSRLLLQRARPEAEIIYAGKKAGQHSLPQDEINQLLIEKARENKKVVRLKGGDPFIFGRGGEEAVALVEAGVKFEVVPGITAGVAAPAYAGIPTTHRDYASELALITGHEDSGRTGPSRIDWELLGRWRGTLVFYMGVKNLPVICAHLQEHGMSGARPAAITAWGTTPRQRTLVGTVSSLTRLAAEHNFESPAVITIGEVVGLQEKLNWFERRELFGERLVVTRSRAQASALAEQLMRLGGEVLEFPTIRIVPPTDLAPLQEAVEGLSGYDWVIFTSVNGVECFFGVLSDMGKDVRQFATAKVCALGSATADRLRTSGLAADLIPPRFVAESIIEALAAAEDLKGKRILLPRADIARADLPETLKKMGAAVDEIVAYHTVIDDSSKDEVIKAIEQDQVDWVTFTSSATVRNFLSQIDLKLLAGKKLRLVSIGPVTSATIRKAGLKADVEAEEYTIGGLVQAICRAVRRKNNDGSY